MTPVKSIRKYCLDCAGNSYKEVRFCPNTNCYLYPFRLGKNPNMVSKMKKASDAITTNNILVVNHIVSTSELKGESHG